MTWKDFVLQWSALDVQRWLNDAPARTVYDWREGKTSPPEWLQPILRSHLLKKSKKPNKGRQGNR